MQKPAIKSVVDLLPPLNVNGGVHVAIVGVNGCGKSVLAKELAKLEQQRRSVIIHDVKNEWSLPGFLPFKTVDELIKANPLHAILQPNPLTAFETMEQDFDKLSKWIFTRKNTALFVDEAYFVTPDSRSMLPSHKALLVAGRSRLISVYTCTQRPMGIPSFIFSESKCKFVFTLETFNDRVIIANNSPLSKEQIALLPERYFYRCNARHYDGAFTIKLP